MVTTPQRSFVRTVLPWLVGAVMLMVYLITLDKVVTVQSVLPLARASGAEWHPVYTSPLSWLVTLPVRWLPANAQLIGLNFVGALCAAMSLVLLARCVSILPHNRTPFQRARLVAGNSLLNIRLAWVPVLFAVLMCGLQRTFWEHAIIWRGEMLDLLLFAYCVRCLLEFRLSEKNPWLYKLALAYGMGIANNFAMIGFFPALLVALLWVKGWPFFRLHFLTRMFLFALAGLSLYLVLPIIQMQSDVQPVTFWQALKTNLVFQKQHVFGFPRWRAGWIGIYALLPLMLAGIRWPGSFDDTSSAGQSFTLLFAIILHAGLLAFCIYIAFDPPTAPRHFGQGLPFLPAYFLGALSIGYFSGFLLLVFQKGRSKLRSRFSAPLLVNHAVAVVVCAGAIFVMTRLVAQNASKIREAISPAMHDYAVALRKSLPEKSALVLSDDPVRLHAVGALLDRSAANTHLLIDTTSLTQPAYHTFLRKRYGARWPKLSPQRGSAAITLQQVVQLLSELGQKHEIIYLHPSFGFYFETFYQEPRKLVYLLKPHSRHSVVARVPDNAIIAEQTAAWNAIATGPLKELKATMAALPSDPAERARHGSTYVAACYSRALDWWGVELQRAVRFDEAAKFFAEAVALNPDNAAALINQEANAAWRSGQRLAQIGKNAKEKLKLYRDLNELLGSCGPVDQPEFAIQIADMLMQRGYYQQAEHLVQRAIAFAPDDLAYRAALANVTLLSQHPDHALTLLYAIAPRVKKSAPALQIEVARIEAFAQYTRDDFPTAERILQRTVERFPEHDASHRALSQLYIIYANKMRAETNLAGARMQLTNALKVIEGQLQVQPNNPAARFQQGTLLISLDDYDNAAVAFTKVLELEKDTSTALLNRAIARLQSNKLDDAERDYQELLRRFTPNYRVYYGLGEIAWRKKNWRAASAHYKDYLRYAQEAAGEEISFVQTRLAQLKKK
jgi:tetratricopeptide (TPR) repeat protein